MSMDMSVLAGVRSGPYVGSKMKDESVRLRSYSGAKENDYFYGTHVRLGLAKAVNPVCSMFRYYNEQTAVRIWVSWSCGSQLDRAHSTIT